LENPVSSPRPEFVALASGFLAGPWTQESLVERGVAMLGSRPRWLRYLVGRVLEAFPDPPGSARDALAAFLATDEKLRRDLARLSSPRIKTWLVDSPRMSPTRFNVPFINTWADLAEFCGVDAPLLDWLSNRGNWGQEREGRLQHYRYTWVPKRQGGYRLLAAPKPRLRNIQRRILHGILDQVPAHAAATAYRPGGSIRAFAAPHTGRFVVLRMDLEDFFASTRGPRVVGLFRELGYPDSVVAGLAGLCTHRVPASVTDRCPETGSEERQSRWRSLKRLQDWNLPQGAPTSPTLANLCAFRMDLRLTAVATPIGARYTRYADDLAFSWSEDASPSLSGLIQLVEQIARDEGYLIRRPKTRVMRRSQRQVLAGTVVNDRVHVSRKERERLEAILTNCIRHGPESQNWARLPHFEAHLRGRIGWVAQLEPRHAVYLEELFGRIAWPLMVAD
jgi:RNA-directed DNA polymerase